MIDTIIHEIQLILAVKRKWLLIWSSSKGLWWGNLKIIYDDESEYVFTSDFRQGQLIPSLESADNIVSLQTDAKFILVIEKETAEVGIK